MPALFIKELLFKYLEWFHYSDTKNTYKTKHVITYRVICFLTAGFVFVFVRC